MNSKGILIGIIVLVVLGAGYWFYADSQKQGPAAQDANTVSDTNSTQVGGEAAPGNDPAMNGTWKSKEDAKFTREFFADGTVTDRYEGDASATMSGTYMFVDASAEADLSTIPAAYLAGAKVIKTTWPNGEIMYFGVQSLTATDLALVNLSGRGNILSFTRVN